MIVQHGQKTTEDCPIARIPIEESALIDSVRNGREKREERREKREEKRGEEKKPPRGEKKKINLLCDSNLTRHW